MKYLLIAIIILMPAISNGDEDIDKYNWKAALDIFEYGFNEGLKCAKMKDDFDKEWRAELIKATVEQIREKHK